MVAPVSAGAPLLRFTHDDPPQPNLFGSCAFYVVALIASTVFAMSGCIAEENKKAEHKAADTRARTLAAQASPVTACKDWMRKLCGEGDRNFAVTGHKILRAQTFNYSIVQLHLSPQQESLQPDRGLPPGWIRSEDAWDPQPR